MKKFLAIFLALITILSVCLVACNDNTSKGNNDGESNDTDDLVVNQPQGSDTDGKDTGTKDTNNSTPSDEWENVSVTVYSMFRIKVRASDSSKNDENVLGSVEMGTPLTATAKSDDWYKVTYNNSDAYVLAEYVTLNANEAQFEKCTNTVLKIKDNGDAENPYTVNLRIAPIVAEDTLGTSIDNTDTANGELVKVGENKAGNWYKVEYTADGNTDTYYIKMTTAIKNYFGLTTGEGDGPSLG